MKLKLINKKDYTAFNSIISTHGCLFNTEQWLNIYNTSKLKILGVFDNNENLIGVFNYYESKKLLMKMIVTPPFSPNNGFFIINPAQNKSNRITFEKEALQLIAEYFSKKNPSIFASAFPVNYQDMQHFTWKGFQSTVRYTYHIQLNQTEDEIYNNLTTEKRKSLKKAEKDNIICSKENDYKIVLDLVLKTFSRIEKTPDTQLLKKIFFEFANESNSFAFVSKANDTTIAASFCVFDNKKAYYLFGGYHSEEKHHGAGVSSMYNCILHAKKIGLEIFDFEGSMIKEVEKYFREFGGDLIPYFEVKKTNKLISLIKN